MARPTEAIRDYRGITNDAIDFGGGEAFLAGLTRAQRETIVRRIAFRVVGYGSRVS